MSTIDATATVAQPVRFHFGTVANPIRMMEFEHDSEEQLLRR